MELNPEELRLASSVGLRGCCCTKTVYSGCFRRGARIHWSGSPKYDDVLAICRVICQVRHPNEFGVFSAAQLAMYLNNLRNNGTLRGFFRWPSGSYKGDPHQQDNVFKFLRACEYGLPQLFSVVELFAKLIPPTNYSLFIAEMPRWFRAEVLKNLDEQGVPVQISERFLRSGDTIDTLRKRLIAEARRRRDTLTPFEKRWILDALAN